jgi:hypothetical protein
MSAQQELSESNKKAIAEKQFEHALLGAEMLVKRRHEIVSGMMGQGKTLADSERGFVEQLGYFLNEARRHGHAAQLPPEDIETRCARFAGELSPTFKLN